MNRSLLQKITLPLFLLLLSNPLFSQNVGINETGANPDASAMLDINTSNKGLLIPRLSRAQKSLIASPANGLLVYQTDDTVGFWYYEQNKWVPVMRSITAGKGLTGGFIQGKGTIDIKPTGVVAKKYGAMDSIPVVTINAEGQITSATTIATNFQNMGTFGFAFTGLMGTSLRTTNPCEPSNLVAFVSLQREFAFACVGAPP